MRAMGRPWLPPPPPLPAPVGFPRSSTGPVPLPIPKPTAISEHGMTVAPSRSMGLPKTVSTLALLTSWLKTCCTEPVTAGCAIFSSIMMVSPSSLQKRRYTQGDCQSGQHDSENGARGSVLDRQPALRRSILNLDGSRSIPVQSAARPAQFHYSCQGDDLPKAGRD